MFESLWKLATHSFEISNPDPSEVGAYWTMPVAGIQGAFLVWCMAAALALGSGWGLVTIASRKGKAPRGRSLKAIGSLVVVFNLVFVWFGPSFAADRRIITIWLAQGESTAQQGTVVKVWDSSSSVRRRGRVRYFASVVVPALTNDPQTYHVSYDSYAAAGADSNVPMRCIEGKVCWLAADLTEISQFCMTALVAAVGNLLLAAGFFYLVQKWRQEPPLPGGAMTI